MAIKLKPKTVGPILVKSSGSDVLYSFDDPESLTPAPPAQFPSHTLMASLGACYLVSMKRVAEQKAIQLPSFTIEITSISSTDLPIRIAQMKVVISGLQLEDQALSDEIVKKAKSMCTVGNTLNCEIETILENAR
jgi:uncharacterized OsmC-like protein